ncbi:hypothetical protein SAMN02745121_01812 [Nannocystis exedens]|uniref:Uncharacterized protein n=1 Tax=Nannocystis exedens TaxID=54 RepID=A0A1I1VN72_9BACT|nr:hypothetical protein [Nannocystis exedens]PCC72696.1 hypothetical protein NAEX_05780 [Nannocystis exedens]SFD84532.1 hypothetical protein SAMN02745121_01812 [Nannocystis exedens]
MDCAAVAGWLGYDAATFPLRRADRCEWPGISLKHRLAEGVAGSYVRPPASTRSRCGDDGEAADRARRTARRLECGRKMS